MHTCRYTSMVTAMETRHIMLDRSMASITAPVDFYVQDRPCLHLNMSVLQNFDPQRRLKGTISAQMDAHEYLDSMT